MGWGSDCRFCHSCLQAGSPLLAVRKGCAGANWHSKVAILQDPPVVCLLITRALQVQWQAEADPAEQSSHSALILINCLQVTRALQVQWGMDLEQQTSRAAAILREISARLPSPSPSGSSAEQPQAVQGVPQRLMEAADQVRHRGPHGRQAFGCVA